MITEFNLSEVEQQKAQEFMDKHCKSGKCKVVSSSGFPIGPLFSFTFTPNGIGMGVTIRCTSCGETEDITDYDSW